MRHAAKLSLVALILAAQATAAGGEAFTVFVDRGEYVVVRVNVTEGNRGFVTDQRLSCEHALGSVEDHLVNAELEIRDGKLLDWRTWVSSESPGFFYASLGYGVGSEIVGADGTRHCDLPGSPLSRTTAQAKSSFAQVHVNGYKPMIMEFTISGPGIVSYDYAVGRAEMKTLTQFDTAVGASVGVLPPIDAAILAKETTQTQSDTVGWFWPERQLETLATVSWSCKQDGAACPNSPTHSGGWLSFAGDGGGEWEFEVVGSLQQNYNQVALGIVTLPDDSYLN